MQNRSVWRRRSHVLFVAILAVRISGCGVKKDIDDVTAAITKVSEDLNGAVSSIQSDQGEWATIVQNAANGMQQDINKLPAELQGTIRTEVNQLAERSVAKAGVQFKSSVDFLGRRAQEGFQRILGELRHETPPPLPPAFDSVSPSMVLMSQSSDRRPSVMLAGYDMDHADAAGHLFGVLMVCENGDKFPFPDIRIGRTTHYECVLDISEPEFERTVAQKHVAKLQVVWDGKSQSAEIQIAPKPAPTPSVEYLLNQVQTAGSPFPAYIPPKTNGDADFAADDANPVDVRVIAQSRIEPTRVMARVNMWARETHGDHTTVAGWSEWRAIYTVPTGGWTIKAVTPIGISNYHRLITRRAEDGNGLFRALMSNGDVVQRLDIHADSDGDEAGTWTKVEAIFSPLTVDLQRTVVH